MGPLIIVILAMLILIGIAMWIVEQRDRSTAPGSESAVVSLRDGLYWAVVTMTTVGYGDKTPKTMPGSRRRHSLDALEPGVGVAVVDQPGVEIDGRARRVPATLPRRSICASESLRR